jgi:hypothetical protein
MTKFAVIVEGVGDVNSISNLLGRTASAFGTIAYTSDPPIRAGHALRLRRPGELERYLSMAASRSDVDEILIFLDLDDACAADFHAEFTERAKQMAGLVNKAVHVCFCVREYECWFLATIDILRTALPEYGIRESAAFPNADQIRGAKEALRSACSMRGYKQSRDQAAFTKRLDVRQLALRDRSFRKLVKCLTGKTYDEIGEVARTR